MSIRWIRNIEIDGEPSTLEIQIGYKRIGDRCYTRIGKNLEIYFQGQSEEREDIVNQGIDYLQQQLIGKSITINGGDLYEWK